MFKSTTVKKLLQEICKPQSPENLQIHSPYPNLKNKKNNQPKL